MFLAQRQTRLRDADVRLDAHQRNVRRDLVWGRGEQRGERGRVHAEEGLVEVGGYEGVRLVVRGGEEGLQFGNGFAEFGARLRGDVDGDLEGVREAEQFGGCCDPGCVLLEWGGGVSEWDEMRW